MASRTRRPIKFLNSKEIKELNTELKESFGFTVPKSLAFIPTKKNKVNIINRDIERLNLDALRIERVGVYFCTQDKYGLRLSIEGSQMFKDKIKKNKLSVSERQMREWLHGIDIQLSSEQAKGMASGQFYIIHHKDDYCGTGRLNEDGTVQNFVPKERRTGVLD